MCAHVRVELKSTTPGGTAPAAVSLHTTSTAAMGVAYCSVALALATSATLLALLLPGLYDDDGLARLPSPPKYPGTL